MADWIGWLEDEDKPNHFCPVTKDMVLVLGMIYIGSTPPGKLVGTFSINDSGVARITLGEK